jgi:hypothetical protein
MRAEVELFKLLEEKNCTLEDQEMVTRCRL